jgi:D-glycero-alpha-D-manno-heptose-7-phosphate kinase
MPRSDRRIVFSSLDQHNKIELSFDDVEKESNILFLHRATYSHIIRKYNNGKHIALELYTYADAPIGSGLGTSSTLVVAMVKAFIELLNIPMDDYEIAHTAFVIERIECGFEGGKQDQYSAAFGGFNFIEFFDNSRVIVNPLRIKKEVISELEASLLLVYTGISRESANIIKNQSESIKAKNSKALDGMHSLKKNALIMKEGMLKGDFKLIEESLRDGWESKRATTSNVSNMMIDDLFETAINNGASTGKISGAGGGGFALFMFDPRFREQLYVALKKLNLDVSNCHFTEDGTQAWKRFI